ncbi:DUF5317 domain-containing protein [Aquibacillus albus]|uniref:DUF5317 domain-containing protein n=1 Tax=Aquibacillus albus TaxID=1168171 RepID=A0ABS2N597_9BACI|nr:DUF5317 domain-containing protein [Aquibacillus albus]MBM7573320.1 hypothetical protein [Aquibacillus albus]
MVYEYLGIAFLIALFKKGSVNRLSETNFKVSSLIIFCLLLQLFAVYAGDYFPIIDQTFTYMIILTYLLLIFASYLNRHLEGFKLFLLGLSLNAIVIIINGGRMPVSAKALETVGMSGDIQVLSSGYKKHELVGDQTLLPFLADVIPLHFPFVLMSIVVSIGDIIMTIGICWFIYQGMTRNQQLSN